VLDPSFNGSGVQTVPFNLGGNTDANAAAVALQPDGKIILAGGAAAFLGAPPEMALVRLNANGSLDNSFGSSGTVAVPFTLGVGNFAFVDAVALQPDGRIVVAGTAPTATNSMVLALARFNANGTLDSSFGSGGETTVPLPGPTGFGGAALGIDGSGRLVVVGSTSDGLVAARLTSTGGLDATFGSGGEVRVVLQASGGTVTAANGLGFEPGTGNIVLGGTLYTSGDVVGPAQMVVARLEASNGTPDPSFGGSGVVRVSFNNGGKDVANTLAVARDGKIVLAGSSGQDEIFPPPSSPNFSDFAVARLNADSSLDSSLQSNLGQPGLRTIVLSSGEHFDSVQAVALVPDGSILLAGNSIANIPLVGLHADGTLATQVVNPLPGQVASVNGMALQPDGRIVLGGSFPLTLGAGLRSDFLAIRLTGVISETQTAGVFDPSTATWYLHNVNASGSPSPDPFQYGGVGWKGIIGDWNGDGVDTIGAFDPGTATWYLRNSNSAGAPDAGVFQYGGAGWKPVVGDWSNSGHTGVGVFDPSTATWYLRNEDSAGAPDAGTFQYGGAGWDPLVGDWTGTGHLGVGIFDPKTATWYLRSSLDSGAPDVAVFQFGGAGWVPVVGDWAGNGQTDIGAFDPSTATWYLKFGIGPGAPDAGVFQFGGGGWQPLVGAYLGPSLNLLAAGDGSGGADALSNADLQAGVAAVLARLQAAGVDPTLLQRLAAGQYQVGALPAGVLGRTYPAVNTVVLSPDAAGLGWFVDPTPLTDEEFAAGQALPGSAAAGREDLLSVLAHEMGHLAGLPDGNGNGLMADALPAGVRNLSSLDQVFSGGL
jgi:uncharacterized delta-60 repeat protein